MPDCISGNKAWITLGCREDQRSKETHTAEKKNNESSHLTSDVGKGIPFSSLASRLHYYDINIVIVQGVFGTIVGVRSVLQET